ncbi:MAG: ABC transporter permease subunit [Methanosarcinaceae archaeon]|nr:ABC transporter permease subunit [Methanosarcinaceae archaeon]MDD4497446.1 ABC transporter permease subunit [Methanosarcinaceae archaeon]
MFDFLKGFRTVFCSELNFTFQKKTLSTYIIFTFFFVLTLYGISAQEYGSMQPRISLGELGFGLEAKEGPLIDIFVFLASFVVSGLEAFDTGGLPRVVMPVNIGLTLFILFPVFQGIKTSSALAVRLCASSLARERESRTLYQLTASPQPRGFIYLGKFFGAFSAVFPIMLLVYGGSFWLLNKTFLPYINGGNANLLSLRVLMVCAVTSFLFATIAMLISTLTSNEENAVNHGTQILKAMGSLTVLWLLLPGLPNMEESTLKILECVTLLSPFTLDLLALYEEKLFAMYILIQIGVAVLLLCFGMAVFAKQDIDY